MSEIITAEQFDEIFDRIIDPDNLRMSMMYLSSAMRNYYVEKFLKESCYKVYYDNQLFYVLTDAKKDIFNHN